MWPKNWPGVQVFLACSWRRHFGAMGGSLWLGIDASEVLAVARLLRIKRSIWPDCLATVRLMVDEVRGDLNKMEQD